VRHKLNEYVENKLRINLDSQRVAMLDFMEQQRAQHHDKD